ncbi:methionine synthase [Natronoglycomyces albus]|uniref:Methionine synthase n=1 Tax=Natronoglycomyces albus TaxID=2811108 RepID=A0A895XXS5_9ACTN|nr:methionine synthase [Natronoglycomyces albus]
MSRRVVIADGAMGTMLQDSDATDDDFLGLEGCNDILCVTRPDIVRDIHGAYLDAGSECVGTNSFNANLGGFSEYDIAHRIREVAAASARLAREACDQASTPDNPRFVLGSMGPGTKLPTLGHAPFAQLRDAYQECATGLLDGGADAILIETSQDLLQTKSAVIGAQRAITDTGIHAAIIAQVTVETTGTMLVGSEIGAALTALTSLGIDVIGMNCATGPAEMTEHLRHLSRHSKVPISVMPNAGLPELTPNGAYYPLTADELADAHETFIRDYGINLIGGCCGTTPEHFRVLSRRLAGAVPPPRSVQIEPGVSSSYHHVPFAQDATILNVGERTNANGSKAFRNAMLEADFDTCTEIAREQARGGSHLLDLCVDYVGRDGAEDMRQLAGRFATASTLPIMLDSTEPAVIEAGLESLGGRSIVNSVNFEDGDGPESRYARMMPLVAEHGASVVALCIDEEGQARTKEWKLAVASRLIDDLTGRWGLNRADIFVDCLTFPISTGQEETRRDGIETIEAIRAISEQYPGVNFTLGVSNISFGLNPAARQVLNSVFLHECVQAGLTSAIVHASKILPIASIPQQQYQVALDLVYDRRREDYDPLQRLIELFEGVDAASSKASRAEALAALPLGDRLRQRIVDGEKNGLHDDLEEALQDSSALEIINNHLLEGMKVVGDLFGSGKMQLPFVLQSAEVMKTAVAHLEPHMEKTDSSGKGTIVLATVRGDVHDIGKNLVDIILSNNGYTVVNLGIKQPINAILDAAEEHDADVIGMSGLLVKSTVIMKDNLAEMMARGMAGRWPVLLGGAALTRSYVEDDLRDMFTGGDVLYARDAFEGLNLMDKVMTSRATGAPILDEARQRKIQQRRERRERHAAVVTETLPDLDDTSVRSDVDPHTEIPVPPFFGTRVVKGIALAEYASMLDERATFLGQWGLRPTRGDDGPSYEELVETEGRPRLRYWLDRLAADGVLEAAAVYGYFPAYSEGNTIVILDENGHSERTRFTFPRQRRERRLCLADFIRAKGEGPLDVIGMQLVTIGRPASDYTAKLFAENAYRDYLEVHGLTVQLTEALAEYWHRRIRSEWTLPSGGAVVDSDPAELRGILDVGFRGCRYSFGYPACPDISDRRALVDLLEAERIGVELSEGDQLHPEQSTDAIVLHHPEASYFNAR